MLWATNYGMSSLAPVTMSIKRAMELMNKYWAAFPQLPTWRNQVMGEQKAYTMGKNDCQIYGQIPPAAMVQEWCKLSDEETVCYLNGVGDGLAGL